MTEFPSGTFVKEARKSTGIMTILIILAIAVLLFGFGTFKVLWELATNLKVVIYIVAGFIVLKLLSALGFKK